MGKVRLRKTLQDVWKNAWGRLAICLSVLISGTALVWKIAGGVGTLSDLLSGFWVWYETLNTPLLGLSALGLIAFFFAVAIIEISKAEEKGGERVLEKESEMRALQERYDRQRFEFEQQTQPLIEILQTINRLNAARSAIAVLLNAEKLIQEQSKDIATYREKPFRYAHSMPPFNEKTQESIGLLNSISWNEIGVSFTQPDVQYPLPSHSKRVNEDAPGPRMMEIDPELETQFMKLLDADAALMRRRIQELRKSCEKEMQKCLNLIGGGNGRTV